MPSEQDQDLLARIDAIGRPQLAFSQHMFARAKAQRAAWDAAHPVEAAEYQRLSAELDARKAAREEAARQKAEDDAIRRRIEQSGAGSRNLELLDKGLRDTPAVVAVREWLGTAQTFLLLSGSPGVGKSGACMITIEHYARQRQGSLFVRAVECSRMSMFDADDKARVRHMRGVSLLVLDDLGVEGLNDAWRESFEDVMDYRYQERLGTLLTTNLPPTAEGETPSFRRRYGERIADRIRHDGAIVQCGSETLRRRPA